MPVKKLPAQPVHQPVASILDGVDIESVCAEWQKRLRLQDWDIDLRVKRWHDLDAQGRCTVTRDLKYAEIELREPSDCPEPGSLGHHDIEQVLVHEMLHIHFNGVNKNPSTSERTAEEQAIIALSRCLVAHGRILPLPS